MEGRHQNIDKFLKTLNQNILAIETNQSLLAKIQEALGC